MVQTALFGRSLGKSDRSWVFSYDLGKQKIGLVGVGETSLAGLDTFLQDHLVSLKSLETADVEMLLAMLREKYGTGLDLALTVCEADGFLYGVLGGKVYLRRGKKGGWLVRESKTPTLLSGKLDLDDVMVVMVGTWEEREISVLMNGQFSEDEHKSAIVLTSAGGQSQAVLEVEEKKTEFGEVGDVGENIPEKKVLTRLGDVMKKFSHVRRRRVDPEVYVKSEDRKRLGLVVIGLFLVLLISVGLGWRKRESLKREEIFEGVYKPGLELLIEAESLAGSQTLLAREKLLEAKKSVTAALSSYGEKSDEYEKLQTLLTQVNSLYEKVSGEVLIQKADVYYDLNLVKEGMFGEKMAFGDGWVTVLDRSRGLLVGIESEGKKAKILAGGELLSGASLVAASTGKAVVLANGGLVGVFFGAREPELLVQKDAIWQDLGALGMFGGNVYLADRGNGELWQYPGYDGGLGERKRWFGPGVLPDLSQVSSVSVDGDIWLGMKDGEIQHYRRGAPMRVNLDGLAVPLEEVLAVWVEYEKEDLFVLDRAHNRVVVFGKEGGYKKQYIWDGIASVSDMVVEDVGGRQTILLLSGATIYGISVE